MGFRSSILASSLLFFVASNSTGFTKNFMNATSAIFAFGAVVSLGIIDKSKNLSLYSNLITDDSSLQVSTDKLNYVLLTPKSPSAYLLFRINVVDSHGVKFQSSTHIGKDWKTRVPSISDPVIQVETFRFSSPTTTQGTNKSSSYQGKFTVTNVNLNPCVYSFTVDGQTHFELINSGTHTITFFLNQDFDSLKSISSVSKYSNLIKQN